MLSVILTDTAFRHKDYADTTIGIYDNFIVGLSARVLPALPIDDRDHP
jgi:hypothetical protein